MTADIYIYGGILQEFERMPGDLTGIPPEASLYCADIWHALVKEAGGEAALITALGVKDIREVAYG